MSYLLTYNHTPFTNGFVHDNIYDSLIIIDGLTINSYVCLQRTVML